MFNTQFCGSFCKKSSFFGNQLFINPELTILALSLSSLVVSYFSGESGWVALDWPEC